MNKYRKYIKCVLILALLLTAQTESVRVCYHDLLKIFSRNIYNQYVIVYGEILIEKGTYQHCEPKNTCLFPFYLSEWNTQLFFSNNKKRNFKIHNDGLFYAVVKKNSSVTWQRIQRSEYISGSSASASVTRFVYIDTEYIIPDSSQPVVYYLGTFYVTPYVQRGRLNDNYTNANIKFFNKFPKLTTFQSSNISISSE